jgi:tetratricopeptide (TPR) repeat protein
MHNQVQFLISKSVECIHCYDFFKAKEYLSKALTIDPKDPEIHRVMGIVLTQLGDLSDAEIFILKSIKLQPNNGYAYINLGNIYLQLGNFNKSLDFYNMAIKLLPQCGEAWSNKGIALNVLKKHEEAIEAQTTAIQVDPTFFPAYTNLGNVYLDLNLYDQAIYYHNKSIELMPDYSLALSNKGETLSRLKKYDEALYNFDLAIDSNPNIPDCYWNKSIALLTLGNFSEGFKLYEWRWKTPKLFKSLGGVRSFTQPLWSGCEPLDGKTILLYAEQGLGDTIQFCRYVSLVSNLGAKVLLEVQAPLVKLLSSIDDYVNVIPKGGALPSFDYQCPLLSLPLVFHTNLETIPMPGKYIKADVKKVAHWQAKLGKKNKPRIGVVWSGSLDHSNDQNRSIPFTKLITYLPPNFDYVCLQKELRESDKELLLKHSEIRWFGEDLGDFSDTAALCELMDVVVSVDTSVAHLAGALGKAAWVLVPYAPDWRWLLDRKDSPWYRSIKLFRQEEMGDWSSALRNVENELIGMTRGI